MKKGFTLVELLAVIIILSLLTLLTINVVVSIVKKGKNEINDTQIVLIEKAAELWFADNKDLLPNEGECVYITLSKLSSDGYIDETLYDINELEQLDGGLKVKVISSLTSTGNLNFKYYFNPEDVAGCTNVGV